MGIRPTRFYSSKQEKAVALAIGGRKVSNSGATCFAKGDVTTDKFLVECKTCTTKKQSFSIKEAWLEKNKEEAFAMGKEYSVLAFNFEPDGENHYIIDEKLFKLLKAAVENEED